MSILKGFSFDRELFLSIPFDFVQRCEEASCDGPSVLALVKFFQQLGEAEYLEPASLEWLPSEVLKILLETGFLLRFESSNEQNTVFLPGTPKGRAQWEALHKGTMRPEELKGNAAQSFRPNLFKLYEDNIGPLTPMVAELLQEDAREYPAEWFQDAIKEAINHNARKWSYVRAVLKRWKENGREKTNEKAGLGLNKYKELYQSQQQKGH
ncbi:MAG: DnaD domain protein [Anaerolineaceae bacterium]|nr:DnaD domain protein [Anaerolineaceae bacterium]